MEALRIVSTFESFEESEFHVQLGQRIRTLRQQKGMALIDLALQAKVTSGFLSQLEHGRKACSLMTLYRITSALDVSVAELFPTDMVGGSEEANWVVRWDARPAIRLPGLRQRLYLLSPSRELSLEPILNVLPPGVTTSDDLTSHLGEEWLYLLRGTVRLELDDSVFVLHSGDSAGFTSSTRHRVTNIGSEDAEMIWVNTPHQFDQYGCRGSGK